MEGRNCIAKQNQFKTATGPKPRAKNQTPNQYTMRECRIIPKMNKFFVHFNVESTCLCVSPPDGHVFIGIHTCIHDIKSGDFWFWGFGRSWLWAARGSSRFFFSHIKRPTTKTTSNKYCSAKQTTPNLTSFWLWYHAIAGHATCPVGPP